MSLETIILYRPKNMSRYLCEKLFNNMHIAYEVSVERSLLQSTRSELRVISKFQLNTFIS